MKAKKCVAMVLAGGRGERLGALTDYYSKPAIHFGDGHRIIDFTLNNCKDAEIDTFAVLSQYFTTDLNEYINSNYGGKPGNRGIYLLSSDNEYSSYKGTADAVFQNLSFIERFMPEYVLILASDHVYRMDYSKLIAYHEEKGADVTAASIPVSIEEAPRFGIMNAGEDGRVLSFEEKPPQPKSNLASMGIYVFKFNLLKKYLRKDSRRTHSNHDFAKDILPEMLTNCRFYTYQFNGYWRDVGTVDRLWEANMEQLDNNFTLQLKDIQCKDTQWNIRGPDGMKTVTRFSGAETNGQNILSDECTIHGYINHSVLGHAVTVGHGSEIINSVIMPNVYIGDNVKIMNAIIGNGTVIRDSTVIGESYGSDFFVDRRICDGNVSLVSPWVDINEGMIIRKNSHVVKEKLDYYYLSTGQKPDFDLETVNCTLLEGDPKWQTKSLV